MYFTTVELLQLFLVNCVCSDKRNTRRNVLNWPLFQFIALLEMYCAAYLHESFSTQSVHTESAGV